MAKYKKTYKSKISNTHTSQHDISKEIEMLEERIKDEAPERGYAPPLSQVVAFRSLPLSRATLSGLEGNDNAKKNAKRFTTMTAIQNACILHALAGRDILGAAKTGRSVRFHSLPYIHY